MDEPSSTRRQVLRTGGAALAALTVGAGTATADKEDKLNPGDFGRVWADGTLFRTNVVRRLDERPDPDDPIYFLNDGEKPIAASVPDQGSPFVSVSSPGEQGWNGGQWSHFSATVTDVEAFRDAVEENGPFASSERVGDAQFIEVADSPGRPTRPNGEPFGPPTFFICPLNGRAKN